MLTRASGLGNLTLGGGPLVDHNLSFGKNGKGAELCILYLDSDEVDCALDGFNFGPHLVSGQGLSGVKKRHNET